MKYTGLYILTTLTLLCLVNSTSFCRQTDLTIAISEIPGADMNLYRIWQEKNATDKDAAANAADLFLNSLDTNARDINIALLYDWLSDWYASRKFLFSKAVHYSEQALRQYKAVGKPEQIAECENKLGKLYYKKGQYHKAFTHISNALQIFKDINSKRGEMTSCMLLGAIYYKYGDFDDTYRCFRTQEELATELNDSLNITKSLHNIAMLSLSEGDTARTTKLLALAIDFGMNIVDTSELCTMYLNTANIYTALGKTDIAEEFLGKARPLTADIYLEGSWYQSFGRLYSYLGDFKKAISCFNKASELLSQGEFDENISSIHRGLHNIYIQLKDTAKAYASLEKISDIWNSYTERQIMLELFHARQDYTKSEAELKLKEEKDRERLVAFISILGILIIAFAVISVYWRKSYLLKKKETEIKNSQKLAEMKKLYYIKMENIINNVIGELDRLRCSVKNEKIKDSIYRINSELKESALKEKSEDYETFVYDYESEFYKRLQRYYPNLTPGEKRLAILISKKLTTKEISEITRQTPESLYLARYRLRKKLGLTGSQESLEDFFQKL